jgi:MtN3 and saliva related transmembrane protein
MSFSLQKNYDEEIENLQKNQSSNTGSLAEIKNTKSKYILDPKYIYIIGFIAGLLTSIAFAPQVFKAFKDKEKTTLTWLTLILASLGQILWITYGTLSHVTVVRIFATVTLTMYLLLVLSKFIFKENIVDNSIKFIQNY